MPYVVPNKSQHKYVLGIDFGHGETSADLCMIQWDESYAQLGLPETIEIFNGAKAINSVLLVEHTPNGDKCYLGGQSASVYSNPKNHKTSHTSFSYYSYFKKVPSAMSVDERRVMGLFMKEVYRQIRKQRNELTDTNHLVYIACPSNPDVWTENELAAYAQIASEAGLPLAKITNARTGLIRESRAAFIKACYAKQTRSSVKEGILLIDFGSSTVDLTYYSSKCERPIDDGGAYCGASQVEKLLFEDLKRSDERVGKVIEANPPAETAMLYYIRQKKEEYYKDCAEYLCLDMNLIMLTGGAQRGHIEKYYSNVDVKFLLSGYIQRVTQCFKDYRDKYLKGRPIRLVFMTGGASRMDFVSEIISKVFGVKNEVFYRETDPSLTISNGIALAGRADLRTYAMEQQLLDNKVIAEVDLATPTLEQAAASIANAAMEKVEECYKNFANQRSDSTIAFLEKEFKKGISNIPQSVYLGDAFKTTLKDITNKQIIPSINGIVKDYFPDFEIPVISSSSTFQVRIDQGSVGTLSDMISDSVERISEDFLEGAAKVVFNILTGTVVIVEAAVENLVKKFRNEFLGKNDKYADIDARIDDFCLSFRDKQTLLSSDLRKQVREGFEGKKSSYHTDICNRIKDILLKEEKLKGQINVVGRNEIKAYISEQVDKARLNLN